MDEKKLTIKISQRINAVMNSVDKALYKREGSDKEFYGILIAPKDNPWMCEDMIVPSQLVTSASITIPKEGMYPPYQKHFQECIEQNKSYIVVGTIHSHNNMNCFFSGGDDEDLDNNSCFNLNENLPFIDIVWSNKDNSYKARARLKIGKGETKQIFTHEDCECMVVPDEYTKMMLQKFKDIVGNNYKVNDKMLSKALLPNVSDAELKSMMDNIKVESYSSSYNGGYKGYQWGGKPKVIEMKGGDVKIEIKPYDETEKVLSLEVKGKDGDITNFMDMVKYNLRDIYDLRSMIFIGDTIKNELKCESKKRYKKMKHKIESLHLRFQSTEKPKLEQKVETQTSIMNEEQAYESFYGGYD